MPVSTRNFFHMQKVKGENSLQWWLTTINSITTPPDAKNQENADDRKKMGH